MGDIKSAREIAMEKVEKLGTATNEERLKWKYAPEGEKLAARYLKQECNLTTELSNYEAKEKEYIMSKLIQLADYKKKKSQNLITNLPECSNNPESIILNRKLY